MEPFKSFAPESRTWVYQANRDLTAAEAILIAKRSNDFVSQWVSHGKNLRGSIEVIHNRFIVVVVDENEDKACGSSIDASLRFIECLNEEVSVELLNRMNISYRSGKEIITCKLSEIEVRIASGLINENTIVFNNLIHSLNEFRTNWEIPLQKSWLMKYLKKQSA